MATVVLFLLRLVVLGLGCLFLSILYRRWRWMGELYLAQPTRLLRSSWWAALLFMGFAVYVMGDTLQRMVTLSDLTWRLPAALVLLGGGFVAVRGVIAANGARGRMIYDERKGGPT